MVFSTRSTYTGGPQGGSTSQVCAFVVEPIIPTAPSSHPEQPKLPRFGLRSGTLISVSFVSFVIQEPAKQARMGVSLEVFLLAGNTMVVIVWSSSPVSVHLPPGTWYSSNGALIITKCPIRLILIGERLFQKFQSLEIIGHVHCVSISGGVLFLFREILRKKQKYQRSNSWKTRTGKIRKIEKLREKQVENLGKKALR